MRGAKDGGAAFPANPSNAHCEPGMSLRDYFAAKVPTDEVQRLMHDNLSRMAQEKLTGMKHPSRPTYKPNDPDEIAFQLAALEFHCAVNAAIRFKLADAMLEARK